MSNNFNLTKINFKNLKTFDGNLEITHNEVLPNCEAEAFEQQLIESGWSGESKIEENLETDAGVCEE